MSNHFKTFFVCPHCEKPLSPEKKLVECIKAGEKYCGYCGKKIADALAEAAAENHDRS